MIDQKELRRLAKLVEDPVLFAKLILGFKPFPYQEEILRCRAKRIIVCSGRQVGKTTVTAVKAIHFAVTNPNTTTLIVSPTLRQSINMFDKILDFVMLSPLLRRSVIYKTRTQIKFSNYSRIKALPCGTEGRTLRGETAHLVIIDEAAFVPEIVITNVVMPMISATDGHLWLLSTPWNKDHIFYKCWTNPKWVKFHVPTSANPLVAREFLEEQRELIGEERYRIEYEAEFIDDQRAFFPMELLRKAVARGGVKGTRFEPEPEMVIGYDPGGKESYAAAVGVKLKGGKFYVLWTWLDKGRTYTDMNVTLADYFKRFNALKMVVDMTGLGNPIVEHLRELGIPVEGTILTDKVKTELLFNVKILLEQGKLILPNDLTLLAHLNCVEYERTRTGGYKFSHRKGTYDDLAFALALALWGAKEAPAPVIVGL